MTKNLRTVKASILMGVILISIFAVLMPSASAGIFKCDAQIKVELANPEQSRFVAPLEGQVEMKLKVGYIITGLMSQAAVNRFSKVQPAQITLSVEETPSFCTATIENNVVSPEIKTGWSYDETATLLISFKENAPAIGPVVIKIKMQSIRLNAVLFEIKAATYYGEISFTPTYRPIIDVTPRVTYVETNPGKSIDIPIDLTNLGNANTEFILDITNVPEGWIASIPANIKVPSASNGETSKTTVMLQVTPPYGFGYHDDTINIELSIYGRYYAGSGTTNATTLRTEIYSPTVTIKSRGFSTPGFEAVFLIFAIVGIAFIVKKRQKIKKN